MKYFTHTNKWWWGTSHTIILEDGVGIVSIDLQDSCPNIGFIRGLSVMADRRKEGVGTALIELCHDFLRKWNRKFSQLIADKHNEWLVKWYESLGYVIIEEDDYNYTMLKAL